MKRLMMAVVVLGLVGCGAVDPTGIMNSKYEVRYELMGTQPIVDYINYIRQDGLSEEKNVGLPWAKTFTAETGEGLALNAFFRGTSNDDTLTGRIYVDGSVVVEKTSIGIQPLVRVDYQL